MEKRIALVACNGGCRNDSCGYGCIGCAACVSVCPADAIAINDCGVAEQPGPGQGCPDRLPGVLHRLRHLRKGVPLRCGEGDGRSFDHRRKPVPLLRHVRREVPPPRHL